MHTSWPLALFWSLCALAGGVAGYRSPPVGAPDVPVTAGPFVAAEGRERPFAEARGRVGGFPTETDEAPRRSLTPLECEILLQEDRLRTMDALFRAGDAIDPLSWAAHVDIDAEQAALVADLDEALERCGSAAEVVALDCDEPPCVALVEGTFDPRSCGALRFCRHTGGGGRSGRGSVSSVAMVASETSTFEGTAERDMPAAWSEGGFA